MEGYLDDLTTLDPRRFQIAVRRLADTLSYGTDYSRYVGSGIEYVQSRPYVYGDPVRSIDWRVTARTGRVHVKDFEAPKRMPVYLLLDTSASMAVTSTPRSKYAVALHVAGGLALACLDRVSPVGVIGVGERELRVEPSLSKDRILRWLLELRRFRYDEETALGPRVLQLDKSLEHRTLVIVLSDLHDAGALRALELLGQTHDVVVLQFQDPAEADLRGGGFLRVREAETARPFVTHGRRRFLDPGTVARALRRAGIDHLLLRTDQRIAQRLRHFFQARGILNRGGR